MKLVLFVLTLLLTGCASTKEYASYLAAQQAMAVQQAEAAKARYAAIARGMETGGDVAKAVGMMALTMSQTTMPSVAPPPESDALKWASILVPSATNLGMGYLTYRAGMVNSNNQRDVAIATNAAFASMGASIATAGTAGYPFVQAPQPNLTLSGTGVLGSGTYTATTNTNSNNTTRNCTGGAAGTATPPAVPGAGGSASC